MISVKRGDGAFKGLWTAYWQGRSFFGTTRPIGVFIGFESRRFYICFPNYGNRRHIGIMLPSGRNWLI